MEEYISKKNRDSSSKHKHKKKKQHKKKKKETRSPSSSDSDEMEWVEASAPEIDRKKEDCSEAISAENKVARDDWMNEEMFVASLSKDEMRLGSSRQKKKEALAKKREDDDAIQRARELNPHWKNNGTGLPEENSIVETPTLPSTSVGDGGYSYLKKAYYRIQEQSQQEGRSMEEIAVERWGSLDKLIALINEAEERMKQNSKSRYSSDKHKRDDHSDRKSPRSFQRPRVEKRSPSPERSFQFQKPKHSRTKDRKLGLFSSTDRKQSEHLDFQRSERGRTSSQERSPKLHSDRYQDDTRRRNIPAWKKVKPDSERKGMTEDTKQDIFVWDKKSSFKNENTFQNEKHLKNKTHQQKAKSPSLSPERVDLYNRNENSSATDELPTIMNEDDLNKLAARCTKAELLGDTALAAKLKLQLEEAREILKSGGCVQSSHRERERVMLTKIDDSGQERPIHYSDDLSESQTKQRKKQNQKFFDDGSQYSLKQMFEREKLTTTDDNLEMFMEVAAKCQDADDDNETSGISKRATNKMAHHLQEEKDVGKAIHQHQKRSNAIVRCNYCLDQPNMKRHLIVKKYKEVYLCIPDFQSIVEGHCLIVPRRHVPSFLALDEEEWGEVKDLKRSLRNMFLQQDKHIITIETSRNFKYYPHAFLEVIPVPDEISDIAPIYFKKAILESETEWANNVKLIDLNKKNIRHSVPKNLPYFWVEFDPKVHAGYAHVIEDEKHFERNFGKEVIGGMLDIDYNHLFKNRKEDATKKSQETVHFIKLWEKFNEEDS